MRPGIRWNVENRIRRGALRIVHVGTCGMFIFYDRTRGNVAAPAFCGDVVRPLASCLDHSAVARRSLTYGQLLQPGTDMGVSEKKGTLLWGHCDTMLGSPIC